MKREKMNNETARKLGLEICPCCDKPKRRRRLVEVLEGAKAEGLISSPPFLEARSNTTKSKAAGHGGRADIAHADLVQDYGTDPSNLGNMPTGEPPKVEGIIASPPYATKTVHDRCDIDPNKLTGNPPGPHSQVFTMADYGNSDGQLAAMREGDAPTDYTHTPGSLTPTPFDARAVTESATFTAVPRREGAVECEWEEEGVDAVISSPPFLDPRGVTGRSHDGLIEGGYSGGKTALNKQMTTETDGQLAALPEGEPPQVDGLVSSPPFASTLGKGGETKGFHSYDENEAYNRSKRDYVIPDAEGQLGQMKEGEPPAMAKPKLASQENHGIISQKEIMPCQTVKTAGSKFQEGVDGVSHAAENMSVQASKDARNPKDLGPKSQQPDLTSQPQNVGVNHIPIGKVEMTVGEDTLGGLSAGQPSTEIGTNVSNVGQQIASKSITKGIKQKPMELGITNSLTLKPSVSNVILPSTVPQNTMQHAPYAERITSQHPLENAVQMNAERNLKSAPDESITENNPSNTFWSAAKTILLQCHQVLAPGGVAIFVTKRFVRNKQIIEFSQQWADLCQSCGFELIEWIKAWLVEERGTQYDLTGEAHTKTIKRFSFFRRLHAQKYPHLAIEWEDVLIFRKPIVPKSY